ncbi:MAG: hypothetical protein AAGI46_02245 [Planctomycetota bacterium]
MRIVLVAGLASLVGLAGCSSEPDVAPPPTPQSVEGARARLITQLEDQGGGTLFLLPLEETTPDGVFENLGLQTFRVKDEPGEVFAYETFAVTSDDAIQVGSGSGGPGITSFTLADADGDGELDLVYVTGSGRGIKSYDAGAIDRPGFVPYDPANPPLADQPVARTPLRSRPVALGYRDPIELRPVASGNGFDVWDPGRRVRLGRLVFREESADFVVADGLPRNVQQRFLSPTP